ncbi:MAG TPA: glycoside hydrolase family 16 protein, partial [Clostridia bacterium]|nr:glycoside hydrolase family 16 protein [Clostridia bacterium]
MKRIFTGMSLLLVIAVILSLYVLYFFENLPNIIKANATMSFYYPTSSIKTNSPAPVYSTPKNEQTEYVTVTATPSNIIAPNQEEEENIWQPVEKERSNDKKLQYYCPENVTLTENGIIIVTKMETRKTKSYTSGMVTSKKAYLYGRFSFQIKVSEGRGIFPAIWLLPAEDKTFPEIDIFEMIGSYPQDFYGVIHYWESNSHKRKYFCKKVEKKEQYEVGLEWAPDKLSWYIDGELVFSTDKGVPNEPMYLIINQAVGGDWAGSPDINTVFPSVFEIVSYEIESETVVE